MPACAPAQIGDRPHQFKPTGTYILPFYDIGFAANFNSQTGAAVTRTITAQTVGGNTSVNVEPLGSFRLDRRTAADLRFFKTS